MSKSVKDKLIDDINKKAQKIRDKRKSASTDKTVEDMVFDFFRQADEARAVAESQGVECINLPILHSAHRVLQDRIHSTYDRKSTVEVMWDDGGDLNTLTYIKGVKIYWSQIYYEANNIEPTVYIGIEQMLLI